MMLSTRRCWLLVTFLHAAAGATASAQESVLLGSDPAGYTNAIGGVAGHALFWHRNLETQELSLFATQGSQGTTRDLGLRIAAQSRPCEPSGFVAHDGVYFGSNEAIVRHWNGTALIHVGAWPGHPCRTFWVFDGKPAEILDDGIHIRTSPTSTYLAIAQPGLGGLFNVWDTPNSPYLYWSQLGGPNMVIRRPDYRVILDPPPCCYLGSTQSEVFLYDSASRAISKWNPDTRVGTQLAPIGGPDSTGWLPRMAEGSTLYFTGFVPTSGREPWMTDGTPEGTRQIAELGEGANNGWFSFSRSASGELLLVDYGATPDTYWRIDGSTLTPVEPNASGPAGIPVPGHPTVSLGILNCTLEKSSLDAGGVVTRHALYMPMPGTCVRRIVTVSRSRVIVEVESQSTPLAEVRSFFIDGFVDGFE
jgi:ELWxxDGT repeat protein